MTADIELERLGLGRLERVDLRAVWGDQVPDLAPWFIRNLDLLSQTLGIQITPMQRELQVEQMTFKIVGADPDERPIVVENHLDPTDHGQLGAVVVHASSLPAVVMVWIAPRFSDQHRRTLRWLNERTDNKVEFFAIELGLVRIGRSLPAPILDVVVQPQNWQKWERRKEQDTEEIPVYEPVPVRPEPPARPPERVPPPLPPPAPRPERMAEPVSSFEPERVAEPARPHRVERPPTPPRPPQPELPTRQPLLASDSWAEPRATPYPPLPPPEPLLPQRPPSAPAPVDPWDLEAPEQRLAGPPPAEEARPPEPEPTTLPSRSRRQSGLQALAAFQSGDKPQNISPAEEQRYKFFEQMFESVAIRRAGFRIPKFGYESWVGFSAGPFGFYDVAFTTGGTVRAGIYLDMQDRTATKRLFDDLFAERMAIETAVGRILSWERLDDRRASRIVDYRDVGDLSLPDELWLAADWAADTVVRLMESLDGRLRSTAQILLARAQGGR